MCFSYLASLETVHITLHTQITYRVPLVVSTCARVHPTHIAALGSVLWIT
jgi:hypothetical protein